MLPWNSRWRKTMSQMSGESILSFQRGLLRHFFRRGPSRPPAGLLEFRVSLSDDLHCDPILTAA